MIRKILTVVLLASGSLLFCSAQVNTISQAQSMFIYNFSRLIQWPASYNTGEFVIGVIGNNELLYTLESYVANKKVGSQPISVKKFDEPANIAKCHIIFVGNSKISKLSEVVAKLQGSNTLIVTERKGMVESGSAIDFFMEGDKLKFVMNTQNAQKYNLVISKSLSDMAYN
ncbi:MAG: YfiR family protein [Bacteroidales bacterium]|nr:YfiR family protein [Bacteroidales bacterium]